jgi:hypothetical protein
MSDVVKSIFRQREVEKIYGINCSNHSWAYIDILRRMEIEEIDKRVLSDKVIGTYDIEIPMLEKGEEFFLEDVEKVVKIKNRMRSTDGSITYYVEDEIVETENSKKSYEFCANKVAQFEEFMKYKEEYKYKHRFFNFRSN